eukprot:366143-Chlamydomonas_euryale.AAC.7
MAQASQPDMKAAADAVPILMMYNWPSSSQTFRRVLEAQGLTWAITGDAFNPRANEPMHTGQPVVSATSGTRTKAAAAAEQRRIAEEERRLTATLKAWHDDDFQDAGVRALVYARPH